MTILVVDSVSTLQSVLPFAQSGDTIQLAPGIYSGLILKGLTFAQDVTITSLDASNPAVLTPFSVLNSQHLTFGNVELQAGDARNSFSFSVTSSSDIHFDHVDVHGTLDSNPANDANGITFLKATNVSVTNSNFHELGRAVAVGTSSNIDISHNSVHDVRSDGFDFAQVDHVTIIGNNISNFHKTNTDHPDAIQFWTSGSTAPSHDILISGNVIAIGAGAGTQGIFFRDQLGNMPYANVTVSDNLIDGTGYNAIRIGHVNGLILTDNVLTTNPGKDVESFFNVSDSDSVVSTNNSAVSIGWDHDTNVVSTGDKIVKASMDYGNANLAVWLHAHGMDDLYGLLQNPGQAPVAATDASGGILPTATTGTTPTITTPVVTVPNVHLPAVFEVHVNLAMFGSDFVL